MSGTENQTPVEVWQCRQVMRVIQSYVDGETDSATAERVAEHLKDCRRCGLEAATYRAIRQSLARHERPTRETVIKLQAFWEDLLRR